MNTAQIIPAALEQDLVEGKIVSLADLRKVLARPASTVVETVTVALPAAVTAEESAALERLPLVYGTVVPDTKRQLSGAELTALHGERTTLDVIEKMVKARKEDIRDTIVNHFDERLREDGDTEGAFIDDRGHFTVAAHQNIDGTKKCWSWEVREGSGGDISETALKALADDPDSPLTHDDYLAMTTPVRLVDEHKLMLHLRKRPELVGELSKAISAKGVPVGSLYVRAAKK